MGMAPRWIWRGKRKLGSLSWVWSGVVGLPPSLQPKERGGLRPSLRRSVGLALSMSR